MPLFLLTKWKMCQTLLILIKRISAPVVTSSFQTIFFKTTAMIKVTLFVPFFFFCCTVDPGDWFAFFRFHILIQEVWHLIVPQNGNLIDPIMLCITVWLSDESSARALQFCCRTQVRDVRGLDTSYILYLYPPFVLLQRAALSATFSAMVTERNMDRQVLGSDWGHWARMCVCVCVLKRKICTLNPFAYAALLCLKVYSSVHLIP